MLSSSIQVTRIGIWAALLWRTVITSRAPGGRLHFPLWLSDAADASVGKKGFPLIHPRDDPPLM